MGAADSSIQRRVPSREISTVSPSMPVMRFSCRQVCTGLGARSRVSSSMMWKTVPSGRPRASAVPQPSIVSATGFIHITLPNGSVVMTPSPIERKVTCRISCWRASSRVMRRDSVTSWFVPTMRVARPFASRTMRAVPCSSRSLPSPVTMRNESSHAPCTSTTA